MAPSQTSRRTASRRATLRRAALASALLCTLLAGCANRPAAGDAAAQTDFDQTNDPYEPTNRFFYKVNDALDAVILKPAALAYVYVVPAAARTGVHNVLRNLDSPVLLANDMMQGNPRRSGDTLMRFLINSTAGVVGVFDVAKDWGYPSHDTDFGVTLALWGVPEGPFLFLPVLGPSNPRDATGYGVDAAIDPLSYVGQGANVTTLRYARYGIFAIDTRANLDSTITSVKKTALDPYATFRSLYRQNRASQIKDTKADTRATSPAWFSNPPPAGTLGSH